MGPIVLSLLQNSAKITEIRVFGMTFTHASTIPHKGNVKLLVENCCSKCKIFTPPSGEYVPETGPACGKPKNEFDDVVAKLAVQLNMERPSLRVRV